ncbi:MAG: T9SS type A sorting domain-containing protein [Bacteroidota bacterium]
MRNPHLLLFLLALYLLGAIPTLFAQPANDQFCNASVLQIDSVCNGLPNATNVGASLEANEPIGFCFSFFAGTQSVWYTFTGDSSGFVDINIQSNIGSLDPVAVAIYTTTDTCTNLFSLTEVACGISGFGGASVIQNFVAPLDSVFYIQVLGTTFNPSGDFCIEVASVASPPSPPVNDSICQASPLIWGASCDTSTIANGMLSGSTFSPNEPEGSCFFPGSSETIWFSFEGSDTANALLTMNDIDAGFVQIAVYEADSCDDFSTLVEIQCDVLGDGDNIFAPVDSGTTYYVQVSSFPFGGGGNFCLELQPAPVLTNDGPCGALTIPVDGSAYAFSNIGATVDSGENILAPPVGELPGQWIENGLDGTVWFQFVAPPGGAAEVQLCHPGTDFDTQLAIYSASDCNDYSGFTLIDANDDTEFDCVQGHPFSSRLESCFTPGDTFYLMIDGFDGELGNMEISITPITAPPITAQLNPVAPDCPGASTGLVQVMASGGLGAYSYQWNTGDSTAVLGGLLPGQYTVTISDACGSSYTDSATVGTASILQVEAGRDQTICLGDTISLGGSPTASGGKQFATTSRLYGIVESGITQNLVSLQLNQPNQTNSLGTVNGDINGGDFTPQGFLALDGTSNMLVRVDTTNGATTNIGTATPNAGHTWSGLAYNQANDTLYAVSTNGLNGRLYYIDPATGASTSGPFLTATQPLWIAIGPTGKTFLLDAATDSIFSVNLQTGQASSFAVPGFTTTAIFRLDADVDPGSGLIYFFDDEGNGPGGVTNLNSLDPGTGTLNLVGGLGVGGTSRACAISGSNTDPYMYAWDPMPGIINTSSPSAMAFPDTATTYSLTVTDACGTMLQDMVTVEVDVQFELTPGVQAGVGTGGSSVSIISGTPPFTYSWSTGDTTSSISGVGSGQYTVTVEDSAGCSATQSIEIWATAIDDLAQAGIQEVRIYPNPNTGMFSIDLDLKEPQHTIFALHDLKGRVLWQAKESDTFHIRKKVQADNLSAGVYILHIATEKGRTTEKVIIE